MSNTVRWLALSLFCLSMLVGGWSYHRWLNGMLAQRAAVKDAALFDFENKDHDDATRVIATIANIDPLKGDMTVRLEINPGEHLLAEDGTLTKEVRVYVNSVNGKAEFPSSAAKASGPSNTSPVWREAPFSTPTTVTRPVWTFPWAAKNPYPWKWRATPRPVASPCVKAN